MIKKDNNKSKIDSLTDKMISSIKIHDDLDKKFVRKIRLMPEIKKKYGFVAKDEKSVESEYFCAGFVEGADWRINSAWHNASEAPQYSGMLITLNKKGLPFLCGPNHSDWETTVKIFHISRWAYVKDLIPNTEE